MPKPTIPKKSLLLAQLISINNNGLPSSGHAIQKVQFSKDTGITQIGFYKPCDPTYPPLLAKYAVAISQMYRLTLDTRAADDRLVFNSEGKIIGTVSIAIEKFVPMLMTGGKSHSNIDTQNLANPSRKLLIDRNIAELLVAAWRHKEDDLHPGNLSVNGSIDRDMSHYNITSIIKGQRFVAGVLTQLPHNATKLLTEDLKHFPNIKSDRTHWPTRTPGNYNLSKAYQASEKFIELEKSTEFKNQMYFALLKELLSFQPTTIQSFLSQHFADSPLGLDDLDSPGSGREKKNKLLNLFNHNLFYHKEQERLFSDHYFRFAKQEYDSFYQLVVHYPGFREYLIEKPEAYQAIVEWFGEQNKKQCDVHFPLDKIDITYHKIWRDSAVKNVVSCISGLQDVIESMECHITLTQNCRNYQLVNPMHSNSKSKLLINTPHINKETIQANRVHNLIQAREQLSEIHNKLHDKSVQYFEEVSPTSKSNQAYIKDSLRLVNLAQGCYSLIGEIEEVKEKTERWIKNWRDTLTELDYKKHEIKRVKNLSRTSIPFVYKARSISSPVIKKDVEKAFGPNEILEIRNAFSDWLKEQSRDSIEPEINRALNEYKGYLSEHKFFWLNPLNFTKTRGNEITKLLLKKEPSAAELIIEIFLNGGWKTTSFNTLLLTKLLKKMVANYGLEIEYTTKHPIIIQLQQDIQNGKSSWSSYLQLIAINLTHDIAEKPMI